MQRGKCHNRGENNHTIISLSERSVFTDAAEDYFTLFYYFISFHFKTFVN